MSFYKSWDFWKRWIHMSQLSMVFAVALGWWNPRTTVSAIIRQIFPSGTCEKRPFPALTTTKSPRTWRFFEIPGRMWETPNHLKLLKKMPGPFKGHLAILNGLKVALCWKGGWNRPVNIFRVQIKQSIWQSEFHLALSNVLNWCKNLYQNITYRWPLTPWQAQMVLALPFPPPSCPYSGATQGNMVTIFLPLRSVREAAIQRRWNKNHSNTQASSDNFILKISQQKSCWNNKKVPN